MVETNWKEMVDGSDTSILAYADWLEESGETDALGKPAVALLRDLPRFAAEVWQEFSRLAQANFFPTLVRLRQDGAVIFEEGEMIAIGRMGLRQTWPIAEMLRRAAEISEREPALVWFQLATGLELESFAGILEKGKDKLTFRKN